MKLELPNPSPDRVAYQEMLIRGLARFPLRKKNFEQYQKSIINKSSIVDYGPIKMDYEVVSRCNFRCIMCRMTEWDGKRAEDMPFEDFVRSLDELFGLIEIKLQGVGEPLLHPKIFDMIALAAERDIWTRLTTNGSTLHINENYKKLIDSNPGEVQISIDGASKEVFETIRKGANFESIVSNVTLLNKYEQSRGLFKTRAWSVVQQANLYQLEEIVLLCNKMAFRRLTFCVALSTWGLEDWAERVAELDVSSMVTYERTQSLIELGKSLGLEVTFWHSSSKYSLEGPNKQVCPWLFERAFISSDLRIVPCCVFSSPDISDFGDATRFLDVWNGKEYQKNRELHLTGKIPAVCKGCYDEGNGSME